MIPTNKFLYKIHYVNSNLCTFCKNEVETVDHLFFDCSITKNFVNAFFDCLKNVYQDLDFKKADFFLGIPGGGVLLNLLLVIAKNFIFKCKLEEKLPQIVGLKNKIKNVYTLEHFVAKKNHREEFFLALWAPLEQIFPNLL